MCAYTVGPQDDYDRWAAEVGDDTFSWKDAVRMRKNIECFDDNLDDEHRRYADPDMETHGTNGPLRVEYAKILEAPMTVQLDAAKESGLSFNPDINSGNPLGLGSCPATSRSGKRFTAAAAYLSSPPGNLKIVSEAQVTKVMFEGKKAVGVIANGNECKHHALHAGSRR